MRERGDRRQRVVELVAITRITFFQIATSCAASSRVSCLKQQQPVRLAVQRERPVASVEDLRLVALRHREQRVARRRRPPRAARCGACSSSVAEAAGPRACGPARNSCRAAMLPKTMCVVRVREHERERRRLDHGVEQQLALVQVVPLAAQAVAERVVLRRRSPSSSGPVGVTLTLKSRSRRLRMPSATARRLWLQRLNMRPVNQIASGSVTRSAAAPARMRRSSQRRRRS